MTQIRTTLQWDHIEAASAIFDSPPDVDRWNHVVIRLDPNPDIENRVLPLYQQTLIQVRFDAVDAIGRTLRHATPNRVS